MAKRYHPDNPRTGNLNKFTIIIEAYRELSDPEKRAAYDVTYDEFHARHWEDTIEPAETPTFSDPEVIRQNILTVLFKQRLKDPSEPGLGLWYIEKLMGWPEKVLEFHIWYMKEKGWIQLSDNGQYVISAEGVDKFEENGNGKHAKGRLKLPPPDNLE